MLHANGLGRWLLLGVWSATALWACGKSHSAPDGQDAAVGGAGGVGGAAAGASTGDVTGDAGSATKIELALDVLRSTRESGWIPAANAHVRAEAAGTATDVLSDARGHARLFVDENAGPWDVTVALAGHSVVTVLGVEGSVQGRVHLSPKSLAPDPEGTTYQLHGAITGRSAQPSTMFVQGLGVNATLFGDSDFSTTFLDYPAAPPLHLLISEQSDEPEWLPLNALWLDVPRTGGDVSVDVVLPNPPRRVRRTSMTLETPQSGSVVATGMTSERDIARRQDGGYSFQVGATWLDPEPSTEGRFAWHTAAFDGDMAPTSASVLLEKDDGHQLLLARAAVASDAVVSIPSAETLDLTGSSIDPLSVTWLAPAHAYVGASLISLGEGSGAWYIYGPASAETSTLAWPHLPEGIALADVGFNDDVTYRVNVFALTEGDGVSPWDWSSLIDQRAVIRTYGPVDGVGGSPGEGGAGAGPGAAGGEAHGSGGVSQGGASNGGAPNGGASDGGAAGSNTWACTAALGFAEPQAITLDGDLRSVVAADFDSDGKPDLAFASGFAGLVRVLRGKGNAKFESPVDYAGGVFPMGLAAADVNGDAKLDLAVADQESVNILLNEGDGTFAAPVSYAVGQYSLSVALGDLNGDGKPDLAVANLSSDDVSVLLNQGDGTFAKATSYALGAGGDSVVMADLNGDDALDLVVATDDLAIFLNQGAGTFAAAHHYPTNVELQHAIAVELDGDGDIDVAAVSGGNTIVLKNLGDGSFGPPSYYEGGPGSRQLTAADFDGDGRNDLAVTDLGAGTVDLTLLRNLGNGAFELISFVPGQGSAMCVATADFDGDGDPDVAVGNFIHDTVSIVVNQCL